MRSTSVVRTSPFFLVISLEQWNINKATTESKSMNPPGFWSIKRIYYKKLICGFRPYLKAACDISESCKRYVGQKEWGENLTLIMVGLTRL